MCISKKDGIYFQILKINDTLFFAIRALFLTGRYQIVIVQFIRLVIEQEYLLGYCTSFEIGSNLKFYSDQNIVKNFLKELVMYE